MASISFSLAIFLSITLSLTLKMSTATVETNEKETLQLHFFMQQRTKFPNATVIKMVSIPIEKSNQSFGDMIAFDNPITQGNDPKSRLLGRAQGTIVTTSLDGNSGLFTVNLIFTDLHPWTGSSLTLMGAIFFQEEIKELPMVGGTGRFRSAKGYVLVRRLSDYEKNNYNCIFELKVIGLH